MGNGQDLQHCGKDGQCGAASQQPSQDGANWAPYASTLDPEVQASPSAVPTAASTPVATPEVAKRFPSSTPRGSHQQRLAPNGSTPTQRLVTPDQSLVFETTPSTGRSTPKPVTNDDSAQIISQVWLWGTRSIAGSCRAKSRSDVYHLGRNR